MNFDDSDRSAPYVVDFVCVKHRLIVEAGVGEHADRVADAERTGWLEAQGWRV